MDLVDATVSVPAAGSTKQIVSPISIETMTTESHLSQIERGGMRSLGAPDLLRLPSLYRATLSSLSTARSISLDRNVVAYLESLAARAYFHIYGTRSGLGGGIAELADQRF